MGASTRLLRRYISRMLFQTGPHGQRMIAAMLYNIHAEQCCWPGHWAQSHSPATPPGQPPLSRLLTSEAAMQCAQPATGLAVTAINSHRVRKNAHEMCNAAHGQLTQIQSQHAMGCVRLHASAQSVAPLHAWITRSLQQTASNKTPQTPHRVILVE